MINSNYVIKRRGATQFKFGRTGAIDCAELVE